MTAAFKNITKANDVTADVGLRISQAVTYTRLCGEVADRIELLFGKQGVQIFRIFKVEFNKLVIGVFTTANTVVVADVALGNTGAL